MPEPCVRGGLPYIFSKTKPVKFVVNRSFLATAMMTRESAEEEAFLREVQREPIAILRTG